MWVAVGVVSSCCWKGRHVSVGLRHSLVEVPGQEEVFVTQRR
jgi:hypothetical protein